MANSRKEHGTYEDRLLKARQSMRAWVRYAIKSSDERIAEYNKIADKYGLDDYEQHCMHLAREGKKNAEKLATKIDSMHIVDMEEFISNHKVPDRDR